MERCEVRTLSQMLAELSIGHVDLLKIDVEKSEWDVLAGIDASDWHKIGQIVLEAHDLDGRVARIQSMLEEHGFSCVVRQPEDLTGTGIYMIYAVNRHARRAGSKCCSGQKSASSENGGAPNRAVSGGLEAARTAHATGLHGTGNVCRAAGDAADG